MRDLDANKSVPQRVRVVVGDQESRPQSNSPFIHENASVPAAMTTQVATVRQRASVPVNCQIARIDTTTATRTHTVVVQNANRATWAGLR